MQRLIQQGPVFVTHFGDFDVAGGVDEGDKANTGTIPSLTQPLPDRSGISLKSADFSVDRGVKSPLMAFYSTESEKCHFHFPHKSLIWAPLSGRVDDFFQSHHPTPWIKVHFHPGQQGRAATWARGYKNVQRPRSNVQRRKDVIANRDRMTRSRPGLQSGG
ncbi:hypothetical protein BMS3Abin14_01627 [bacterium BMS3Abin14]|nr:hypothetical protein BMS3Abin14_01627 [bacterium BMS3Abin14]